MEYVEDNEVSHVIDSHAGRYMAQEFAARWGAFITPADASWVAADVSRLKAGPDTGAPEAYEDAWCNILDNATVTLGGKTFHIHEDEGIYLVRDGVEWCDECEWFKSTECDCPHITTP